MRLQVVLLACAACGSRAADPTPAPATLRASSVDATPTAPPDAATAVAPSAAAAQLARLFPDRRPEIPPSLGVRFGEPIAEARPHLPPAYEIPRIDVQDEGGRVKQVFVEELAATTDDLRTLWGNEPSDYLGHWFDPERGVRAIANESADGLMIRIERYQPLAPLLARLPMRPGIGVRELAAAVGGDVYAHPAEVRLPPIEGDETIGSTSIYVRPDGYSLRLYGGRDEVHAALVAQWGQPHVDDLHGPEVFSTSPRVTACWSDGVGVAGGAWDVTIGREEPAP